MDEREFKELYEKEIPIYREWGNFVKQRIKERLLDVVSDVEMFLKIEIPVRVKGTNSIIEKAFYRDKNYKDPYNDIEDKVGIRFVVLLSEHIKTICGIIEAEKVWNASKDKDYENEREMSPTTFVYQSVHYVVRNNIEMELGGINFPKNIPCEIQIRTLLQHAYCELTHDTTYKPKTRIIPKVHRIIARSMALIETTDNLFEEVIAMLHTTEAPYDGFISELSVLYKTIIEPDYEEKINSLIFDAYKSTLGNISIEDIKKFLEEYSFIKKLIKEGYSHNLLNRQPVVLLIYYLISQSPYKTKEMWPLTESQLKPLYINLGNSFG